MQRMAVRVEPIVICDYDRWDIALRQTWIILRSNDSKNLSDTHCTLKQHTRRGILRPHIYTQRWRTIMHIVLFRCFFLKIVKTLAGKRVRNLSIFVMRNALRSSHYRRTMWWIYNLHTLGLKPKCANEMKPVAKSFATIGSLPRIWNDGITLEPCAHIGCDVKLEFKAPDDDVGGGEGE